LNCSRQKKEQLASFSPAPRSAARLQQFLAVAFEVELQLSNQCTTILAIIAP
jgi:hypothetical protein